jgi:hypothetical protein
MHELKRENSFVSSKLICFTKRVISVAKKRAAASHIKRTEEGKKGYADLVIVSIHDLQGYLEHPYRRLLDVLHEMHSIVSKLGMS